MARKLSDAKALYDEFGGDLFKYFFRSTGGNVEAAFDCVQEVFALVGKNETELPDSFERCHELLFRFARKVAVERRKGVSNLIVPYPSNDFDARSASEDPLAKLL